MLDAAVSRIAFSAAESGWLPDSLIRIGIRRLLKKRVLALPAIASQQAEDHQREFLNRCAQSRIAEVPEKANEQHYEVPAEFFKQALGPHLKYSCCHWGPDTSTLQQAEQEALSITCERAGLQDGMEILELGCGWGSLSLWMADHFPNSKIVAVSNSRPQRQYIETEAAKRGIANLSVLTVDINDLAIGPQGLTRVACDGGPTGRSFDRVVSVEMFEHVRNHAELLRRVASWLKPDGKLFVHIFAHKHQPYFFEDDRNWMTRHFFAGGIMPSEDLLSNYQQDLRLAEQWRWSGTHYERTCNAWLQLTDRRKASILSCLRETYGERNAFRWLQRWRIFFMACAELFGYDEGSEWGVCHYLFEKPE